VYILETLQADGQRTPGAPVSLSIAAPGPASRLYLPAVWR
jgi:hypothetical protein